MHISLLLSFIGVIILIYFVYCGYKWFKSRKSPKLKHHYKKRFWISLAAYVVISLCVAGMSPSDNHSNHANHSAKTVAYHNHGNAKQNFNYFKNHAIHKFSDYTTKHPVQNGPATKSADGVHWSKDNQDFIIDTDADAHSSSDKHVQAEACFTEFKRFMKKYEPMSKSQWDGTVEFQDTYGDQITTGNVYYKHLDEHGLGFDD